MLKCRAGRAFSVALAVGAVVWGGRARAETPRVAVAPVAGEHAPAEVKDRVARSLAEGLLASGADVAASPSDAPYVLRGRVEVEGRSYTLHLEMFDRRTGAVVASREDRCEICTEAEAFETASAAASTLKAQVFKRQGGAGAAPLGSGASTTPVASAAVPPARAGGGSASTSVPGAPALPPGSVAVIPVPPGAEPLELRSHRASPPHRGLGWASVAAGVLSAGAGAALVAVDGSGTCNGPDTCPHLYDTRWGGVALIGVGVVAVGAGLLAILGKL